MSTPYEQLKLARTLVQHLALNVPEHLSFAVQALSQVIGHMADEARQTGLSDELPT